MRRLDKLDDRGWWVDRLDDRSRRTVDGVYDAARLHRIPGRGHLLLGLSHYPFLALAVVIVLVALAYYSRRR